MGNVVKLETNYTPKKPERQKHSSLAEDPNAEYLLSGTGPGGKKVYYFRLSITGLRDRFFGPYDSRSKAVGEFDRVLGDVHTSFCELQNRAEAGVFVQHIALPIDLTGITR